jgi:hypothetical protein
MIYKVHKKQQNFSRVISIADFIIAEEKISSQRVNAYHFIRGRLPTSFSLKLCSIIGKLFKIKPLYDNSAPFYELFIL